MGLLTVRRVPRPVLWALNRYSLAGSPNRPSSTSVLTGSQQMFPSQRGRCSDGFIRGDGRAGDPWGWERPGQPAVKGEAEPGTVERGNVTSEGRGPGGTKVMFWVRPEAGTPPGLVPVGPQGALQADAESQRAGGGGSAWVYSGKGQVLPGAAWLRMGAELLWDTSNNWRSVCICTEVDLRAQLIFP